MIDLNETDTLNLAIEIFNVFGIQSLLWEDPSDISPDFDYNLRKKLQPDYSYDNLAAHIKKLLKENIVYFHTDSFGLHYVFYRFPDKLKFSKSILVLGPMLFTPMTPDDLQEIMNIHHISPTAGQDMMEFYNQIPIPFSPDQLLNLVYYFLKPLTRSTPASRQTDSRHLYQFQDDFANYYVEDYDALQKEVVEKRYYWEKEIIRAVSLGNQEQALEAHKEFTKYRLMKRVPDPVRNRKNMSLILNTLLRTAAIQGGVYSLHVDNLSRRIHIEIESLHSVSMLNALSKSMIHRYCILVNNYSRKGYPELIKNCMNYIDFHYAEDLSLHKLADMNYVSDSYLSTLFKKSTSMSLIDYINSIRIKQSLVLLNSTDLSIEEIADKCGFSGYNYFSRTFKR
jgi:two-component system response regulator YesN